MLPVVTMVGMDIGLLLGGAIFIEAVFGLNGLGGTAPSRSDHPVPGRRDLAPSRSSSARSWSTSSTRGSIRAYA